MKKGIFVQIRLLCQDYDPDFLLKKLQQIFRKQNLKILSQTLGKARRGAQWKLIFCLKGLHSELRRKAQNSDFHWGPLLAFPNVLRNICKFCFLHVHCNFWVKYLGHHLLKDHFILTNMPFSLRNKTSLLNIFWL